MIFIGFPCFNTDKSNLLLFYTRRSQYFTIKKQQTLNKFHSLNAQLAQSVATQSTHILFKFSITWWLLIPQPFPFPQTFTQFSSIVNNGIREFHTFLQEDFKRTKSAKRNFLYRRCFYAHKKYKKYKTPNKQLSSS